jgi:glycosyltransferase involved in cell wall biosynthesis
MLHLHTGAVPLVSVVLPFFNEQRFLEEAVQSVRDQQLADWELILVDDGSTNRSTLMARDLAAKDGRIRYVDHPGHQNRGTSASRNLGAAHATAPYIAFVDADDVSVPDKLAEQVDLLENMPDVAMVDGALLYWSSWDPASTKADRVVLTGGMADRRLDPPEPMLALYPLGPGVLPGVFGLVRRSAFDAVGGWEERFRGLYDDHAFRIKIYLRYPIYISSRTWYHYRQHDASYCSQTSRTDYWRLRGVFLEWLEAYLGPHGDPRVLAAIRRAHRELLYKRLTAPVLDRLPEEFQRRLSALAGRTTSEGVAEYI